MDDTALEIDFMIKRIKVSLLITFTALLMLCAALLAFPMNKAKADTVVINTTSDENFSFVPGAALNLATFNEDQHALRFRFKLDKYRYENLSSLVTRGTTFWGGLATNVFIYEFTLCRSNNDGDGQGSLGTAEEEFSMLVVIFTDRDQNFYGYIAEKNYYYGSYINDSLLTGTMIDNATHTDYDGIATNGRTFDCSKIDNVKRTFGGGYAIKSKFKLSNSNLDFMENNGLVLNLIVYTQSPFSNYLIRSRYYYQYVTGATMFDTPYNEVCGATDSATRSVAGLLQAYYDDGIDIEEMFGDNADYAYEILRSQASQHVKIKYLTEIEGTPYATHNFAYVDVPVLRDTIYISDVEQALGISLFKCLDSNAYCFQKETDATEGEYYRLYYLRNVWLRSMTEDGNYLDYFLDINNSYKDMYRPYVESGILDDGAYEWIYSTQFLNKFPALQGYRFNEVYGYFGLVVLPETYTLNSALVKMFDVKTSKIGVISNFSYSGTLSSEAYDRLLSAYNYSFLNKIWAHYANFVGSTSTTNATYYVIYSEPGTENALIGEGGQENPDDGSFLEEVTKEYTDIVVDIYGTFLNGVVGLLKGAGNHLTEILIIAAIVAGVILLFKFGIIGGNKRRRK